MKGTCSMMLQTSNNSQPTFGMAIKIPATDAGKRQFAKYINIDRPFVKRGLNRLARQQSKNPFDIIFDRGRIHVQKENMICDTFIIENCKNKNASKTLRESLKQACKGLYYAIFKPEVYLPKELKQAAKSANEQHKKLLNQIKEEKAGEKLEEILSKYLK